MVVVVVVAIQYTGYTLCWTVIANTLGTAILSNLSAVLIDNYYRLRGPFISIY